MVGTAGTVGAAVTVTVALLLHAELPTAVAAATRYWYVAPTVTAMYA